MTLPQPMTSGAKAEGRFGQQDFVYRPAEDVDRCPAGAILKYRYTNVENGLTLRRYWTTACPSCLIKNPCTPAKQRRITRWEHEPILDAVQRRLDENPKAMRPRRETVEHPFGTIKARTGATHFLMKTLPRVSGEMALHVLAYNLTRAINLVGSRLLIAALRASGRAAVTSILGVRQASTAHHAPPPLSSGPTTAIPRQSLHDNRAAKPTPSRNGVLTRPRPKAAVTVDGIRDVKVVVTANGLMASDPSPW